MANRRAFQNILVSADESPSSIVGQELAASIAKRYKSKVKVINVIAHELMIPQMQRFAAEAPEYFSPGGIRSPGAQGEQGQVPVNLPSSHPSQLVSELTGLRRQEGEHIVADAKLLFKEEGVDADTELIEHAHPAETILNKAHEEKRDLIVLGRSTEEEKAAYLGSVASKVSRHSKVPVLIAGGSSRISNILVPTDGSQSAEKALPHAVSLAKEMEAKMTLLYVQESRLSRVKPELAKQIGERILASGVEQAKGVEVDRVLASGDPAKVIVQTAKKGNYDLIVMGCHGHSAIERFLLGSVADHVIHYADLSVLLVK